MKFLKPSTLLLVTTVMGASAFASHSYWDSSIWTTWHLKKTMVQGLIALAKIREKLSHENLTDPYTKSRPALDCSAPSKRMYRQNDGTCNDFSIPTMGAANTRISRNLKDPSILKNGVDPKDILEPNPLEISRELLARNSTSPDDDQYIKAPGLNVLAAAWIQFETHDWFNHGKNMNDISVTSPWVVESRNAKQSEISRMILPRTQIDESLKYDHPGYATYNNVVTHWWDASQIYGSSVDQIDCDKSKSAVTLRECKNGRLKLTSENLLPIDQKEGKEKTGFNDNWWLGLSFLHTLFERNHNQIAARLQAQYPQMDDEQLFQTARLINAAIIAKIHTVEWTPGILDNKILKVAMNSNWNGLERYLQFSKNPKTIGFIQSLCNSATSKPSHICQILGGIVGGKKDLNGKPFSMTEEFVSVYRMHSLLPENIEFHQGTAVTKVPIKETREGKAAGVVNQFGMTEVAKALGFQNAGALTLQNFPRFLRKLEVGVPGMKNTSFLDFDMAAVDVIRDRERQIPRYNEFRRQLNLKPIRIFEDLMPQRAVPEMGVTEEQAEKNRELTQKLASIYKNVENIDLLVGELAEGYRPQGYGFGETLFQVFIVMASRRLQADRFYTDDFRPEIYTSLGMKIIEEATMKNVILSNFKDLNPAIIPENAFAPWKEVK